jgi:hypothetical protein
MACVPIFIVAFEQFFGACVPYFCNVDNGSYPKYLKYNSDQKWSLFTLFCFCYDYNLENVLHVWFYAHDSTCSVCPKVLSCSS